MKRIVLFRFHKEPKICLNRLELIKKYNPNVKIYGIFGGDEKQLSKFHLLDKYIEHIHIIPQHDWKWRFFDLALKDWFLHFAYQLDFDIVHIIEWDLLYFDSLDSIFRNIQKNENAIACLEFMSNVEHKWDWICEEPYSKEWIELKIYLSKHFNYSSNYYASLGPGLSLCYNFLKEYSKIEDLYLTNDEVKIPNFSTALGFTNKSFFDFNWFSDNGVYMYYNCVNKEININMIKQELLNKNGRRIFHPYRKIFPFK